MKRLTFNEAILNYNQLNKAKLTISTNKIRFISANKYGSSDKNSFKDSIEILDDKINLLNYGIVKGDQALIGGSSELVIIVGRSI